MEITAKSLQWRNVWWWSRCPVESGDSDVLPPVEDAEDIDCVSLFIYGIQRMIVLYDHRAYFSRLPWARRPYMKSFRHLVKRFKFLIYQITQLVGGLRIFKLDGDIFIDCIYISLGFRLYDDMISFCHGASENPCELPQCSALCPRALNHILSGVQHQTPLSSCLIYQAAA